MLCPHPTYINKQINKCVVSLVFPGVEAIGGKAPVGFYFGLITDLEFSEMLIECGLNLIAKQDTCCRWRF